jgi:hypothetical protein
VRGWAVENAPESIRLFSICEALKWNHLPNEGGIYDQHPDLLDQWQVVWQERAKYESEQERKSKAQQRKPRPR